MPRLVLHEFKMGDVDDIEIYAAQPIYEWQQTAQGKWCMTHARDLYYQTTIDPHQFGYQINIIGDLEDKLATEFLLKWQK